MLLPSLQKEDGLSGRASLVRMAIALSLLSACGRSSNPSGPAPPPAILSGSWKVSSSSPQAGCTDSYTLQISQSDRHFDGFNTVFIGDSTILTRTLSGTVEGDSLRGNFTESMTFSGSTVCSGSGEFEGSVLSQARIDISIPVIRGNDFRICGVCASRSLILRR